MQNGARQRSQDEDVASQTPFTSFSVDAVVSNVVAVAVAVPALGSKSAMYIVDPSADLLAECGSSADQSSHNLRSSDDRLEPVVDVQTREGDRAGRHLLRRRRCLLDRSRRAVSAGHDGVVEILVERATTRVHEEVCDGRHFEAELLGDRRLHVLVGPTSFLEDGQQSSTLYVGEDESRLLVDLTDRSVARRAVRQTALMML